MAKKGKSKFLKRPPMIKSEQNLVGTDKTFEVLRSEQIGREAVEVFHDTVRIPRYYPPVKLRHKTKHKNGKIIIYSPKQIKEIEMEQLTEALKKKIEERQKQIRALLKKTDILARLALGVLLSTGLKMSIDDLILEIGTVKDELPAKNSVYAAIRKISNGPFGKLISVTGKWSKYYKIRYPEVSLVDFETALDCAINRKTEFTLDDVIKTAPELQTVLAGKIDKGAAAPKADEENAKDKSRKTKEESLKEEDEEKEKETAEDAAIDDFFDALKAATKAARKIPGFEFEGEFASKSQN